MVKQKRIDKKDITEIWGEEFNDKKDKFTRKKFKFNNDDKPIQLKNDTVKFITILKNQINDIPDVLYI